MSFLGDEHHTFGYGRPLVVLKAGSNRWPNSLAMCRSSSWYHCILSPRWRRRSAITWAPNSPLGELYEGGKKMSRYIVSKSTIINITHTLQPQLETLEPMWNTSVRHINSIRKAPWTAQFHQLPLCVWHKILLSYCSSISINLFM